MQNVLEKKNVAENSSKNRESLMYEVLMESGMNGFVKKFSLERQARPLVKHDWLFE